MLDTGLLVEQVDRLSRLSDVDWAGLKGEIKMRSVRIDALDLPTSWECLKDGDSFTKAMLAAVNGMLLDMLAAIARKDYTDRRRRQNEGIEKAKAEGKFKGRRKDEKRHAEQGHVMDRYTDSHQRQPLDHQAGELCEKTQASEAELSPV